MCDDNCYKKGKLAQDIEKLNYSLQIIHRDLRLLKEKNLFNDIDQDDKIHESQSKTDVSEDLNSID